MTSLPNGRFRAATARERLRWAVGSLISVGLFLSMNYREWLERQAAPIAFSRVESPSRITRKADLRAATEWSGLACSAIS